MSYRSGAFTLRPATDERAKSWRSTSALAAVLRGGQGFFWKGILGRGVSGVLVLGTVPVCWFGLGLF